MPTIAAILIFIVAGSWCLFFAGIFFASLFISAFIVPLIVIPILLIPFVALAFLAIFGAISALQRKRWGLALAGSIITSLPFNLLGVAALVLIALSKNEFN